MPDLIYPHIHALAASLFIMFIPIETWSREELLELAGVLLAAVAILLAVAAIIATLWGWTLRSWLAERRVAAAFGADLYSTEDIKDATRYYVRPHASSIDLIQELEKGINIVATREDLFKAVERFIDEQSPHHHMLLLADSGMGKSSFLLNYYAHNQRRWRKRYKLVVIPLGNKKALDMINEINHQARKEMILFLDAFDEDLEALKNYWRRLDDLMQACSSFRRVLITCRTQFFPKDEAIPQLATMVVGPRSGSAHHTFWHMYLAPFSDNQVDTYLKRRFGFWAIREKNKARALVKRVPNLTVRPLLLSYIADLLETEESVTLTWYIYKVLTSKWYEREKGFWEEARNLEIFSEEVAVQLYLGFLQYGYDRVQRTVITNIVKNSLSFIKEIDEWKATSRSLLHRDGKGNWKFAHRSIMEFLFLKKYFEGDERCRGKKWTEQMKKFVLERDANGKALFLSLGSISGADLSGADLGDIDFRGIDLSRTDLSNTDLRRVTLRGANLSGANLSGANLSRVDLHEQNLNGVNLNGADLSDTNLSGIDLSNTDLRRVTLRGANLSGANLSGANLSGIDFSQVELSQVCLSRANLSDSLLDDKDFKGMNLSHVDLSRASLRRVDFSRADLSGTKFSGAELSGANLSGVMLCGAEVRGVDFSHANLHMADLSKMDLSQVKFSGANLSQAILNGADLYDTTLRDANLNEADFNGASLIQADLRGADLRGANFTGAKFSRARFNRTDIACLKNIDENQLSGAIIEESLVPNSNLTNQNKVDGDLANLPSTHRKDM